MPASLSRIAWAFVLLSGSLVVSSCADSAASSPPAASQAGAKPAKPVVPPAVSIGETLPVLESDATTTAVRPASGTAADDDPLADEVGEPEEPLVEPQPGSPQWLIREITRLQSAPIDTVRTPIPGKPGEFEVVTLTDEQIDAEQVRRADKVIHLALEVCAKTKDDKSQLLLFNNAVHYLANSRVTLASYGDREQVKLLGDEAEMLFQRDPKSFAAMDVQLKLVEGLAELAEQEGRKNGEWSVLAARAARLFATRFPQDTNRSALALVSAARACEVAARFDDARLCFLQLEKDFSKTPFAEQAAGALRRYKLTGQPLVEFAGPTIDGGFLSIDQFKGQPVLIVFWSAESPSFREDLPRLGQFLTSKASKSLAVIGVNMDVDEAAVDTFLEQAELNWKTIFPSSLEQRGVRQPLARAYGVTTVPQYWLVDPRGVVVAAPVDLKTLEARTAQMAAGESATRR